MLQQKPQQISAEQAAPGDWPPIFSMDQEKILNLLTGDRFYSDVSAALREAVLNAIDATHRRRSKEPRLKSDIVVHFDRSRLTLSVSDNGDGMNRDAVRGLFTRVGATAAELDAGTGSIGEFGIGVISYFMAGDSFILQTFDGTTEPVGLKFTRAMLAGGAAEPITPNQKSRGTTLEIHVRSNEIFDVLVEKFPHWCRDVPGLRSTLSPEGKELTQGGPLRPGTVVQLSGPAWVDHAHLAPVSSPGGWDAMSGASTVAILYRGVFVQLYTAPHLWGIEGSIDVDPKHFKPRLNRESFIEGEFQKQVYAFLKQAHPTILEAMAQGISAALDKGYLDRWTVRRWATLWLSIPRDSAYTSAAAAWDRLFRRIPAFERAVGNAWESISLTQLLTLPQPIYVAPLADEQKKLNEVVNAALRLLRHTGHSVVRGIRADRSWLKDAHNAYGTTADLIRAVFANELAQMIPLTGAAEGILSAVEPVVNLFAGTPPVDLVKIGGDSPPILSLRAHKLLINLDHPKGRAIVEDALIQNTGPFSLITIAARHSHQHLQEVAAAVRECPSAPQTLGLVKRRYIRSLIS